MCVYTMYMYMYIVALCVCISVKNVTPAAIYMYYSMGGFSSGNAQRIMNYIIHTALQ